MRALFSVLVDLNLLECIDGLLGPEIHSKQSFKAGKDLETSRSLSIGSK